MAVAPSAVREVPMARNAKHYSGATLEARKELAGMWENIMDRATDQVTRTVFRAGITDGALKRRQMEEVA